MAKQLGDTDTLPGESGRAARILDDGFKQPAGETVLVQSRTLTADDPAFRAAVADVVRRVSAVPVVTNVQSPYTGGNRGQISADSHSAIVDLDIRGDADTAVDRIDPVMKAVDATAAAHPSLRIQEFGVTADKQLDEKFNKDLERAGLLSLPVTIVILVIAFGALVAAGIPLLLALSAVMATMGLLAIPSQVWPVDENISAIVLLIGLAVASIAHGMYFAVDLALVTDVLPDPQHDAAKDLGILNMTNALPQIVAPLAGAAILLVAQGSYETMYAVAGAIALLGAVALLPIRAR